MGEAEESLSTRIGAYLRSNALGLVAIFIALCGSAIAAGTVERNSVTSKSIRNKQVKRPDLARRAVGARQLGTNAVASHNVADGALTGADIKNQALTGLDIDEASLDRTVIQRRIEQSCPTGEAVRRIYVTGAVLCGTAGALSGLAGGDLTGSFPNPLIAEGAVDSAKLLNGAIAGVDVATDALGAGQIDESSLDAAVLQRRLSGTCGSGLAILSVAQSGTISCGGAAPSGAAGGILDGTFPNPGLDESALDFSVVQQRLSGTCAAGETILSVAQNGAITCSTTTPSGSAGGVLTGTYPAPGLGNNAVGTANVTNGDLLGEDLAGNTLGGTQIDEADLDTTLLGSRAYGTVSSAGTLSNSEGVDAVTHPSTGVYCIDPAGGITASSAALILTRDIGSTLSGVLNQAWASGNPNCGVGTLEVQSYVITVPVLGSVLPSLSNGGFSFVIP